MQQMLSRFRAPRTWSRHTSPTGYHVMRPARCPARHCLGCSRLHPLSSGCPGIQQALRPKVNHQLQHQGQNGRAAYLEKHPALARIMLALYDQTFGVCTRAGTGPGLPRRQIPEFVCRFLGVSGAIKTSNRGLRSTRPGKTAHHIPQMALWKFSTSIR